MVLPSQKAINVLLCWPSSHQIKDTVAIDAGRANKEAETLRKQCKALCQELKEALQEADVAKCRRDWAFQERDKIVAERDSIRYGALGGVASGLPWHTGSVGRAAVICYGSG